MNSDDNNIGGGSGGDAGMTLQGHVTKSAKGAYQIGGNQVVLVSRERIETDPPTNPKYKTDPGPSKIVLLATGTATKGFIDDGCVEARGVKGVRITSGVVEASNISPPVSSASTNGVEVVASEPQSILLHRGLVDGTDQKIEMTPGTPGAILVDGGAGPVTVQSTTMITLKVGQSSITLLPDSIVIKSDTVTVLGSKILSNAQQLVSIMSASGQVQVVGGQVMIN